MSEEWRSIPRFPGYEVSDLGRVRSLRVGSVPRLMNGTKVGRDGYLYIGLRLDGRSRCVSIHRLVGETFLGPLPEGYQTRHLDGDRQNNRLSNLKYGTPSENAFDKQLHGTVTRVTRCPAGHPYDEANTYVYVRPPNKYGVRLEAHHCRACSAERQRVRVAARKATA